MSDRDHFNSDTDYVDINVYLKQKHIAKREISKTKAEQQELLNFLVFVLVILSFVFVIEAIVRIPLAELGVTLQKSLGIMLKGKRNCDVFNSLEVYFNNFNSFMFLLIFIFHTFDAYSTFAWLGLYCVGMFVNGILIVIYRDPRPFWYMKDYAPCSCKVGYGNPSNSTICGFIMIMGLYKITVQNNNKVTKYVFLVICMLILLTSCTFDLLRNTENLSQIIFGLAIAFIIYYSYFKLLWNDSSVQEENTDLLYQIFEANLGIKLGVLFVLVSVILNITHYILKHSIKYFNPTWFSNLNFFCTEYKTNFLDKESYFMLSYGFLLLGGIVSLYLEFWFAFSSDIVKFSEYNFEGFNRWNQSNFLLLLLRIFVTFGSFYFVHSFSDSFVKTEDTITNIAIFSFLLFFYGLFIFGFSKWLFRVLHLTNESVINDYIQIDNYKYRNSCPVIIDDINAGKNHLITADYLLLSTHSNRNTEDKIQTNDNEKIDYFNLERDTIDEMRKNTRDFYTPPDYSAEVHIQ